MIRIPLQSGATADFMSTTGHFFHLESDFKPVDPFTSWMAALLNSAVYHPSYAFNIPNERVEASCQLLCAIDVCNLPNKVYN